MDSSSAARANCSRIASAICATVPAAQQVLLRQVNLQGVIHPRQHLGGQQRMAAQFQKAVVPANQLQFQNLLPDAGQLHFERCCRRGIGRTKVGSSTVGVGQREPVDLAIGIARQCIREDEPGGNHIIRQRLRQLVVDVAGGVGGRNRCEVRDQILVADRILATGH